MPATMKDIAERTGLGLATISKYYNGRNVRERNRALIEQAARDLHFTPNAFAQGLKTSKSHTVGVVIPELSNAFITSIITTLEDILRKHGYAVIICDCRTDEALEMQAVRFLVDKMVDGIINMPVTPDGRHLEAALSKGLPIVLIDRMIKKLAGRLSAVIIDNADAVEKGTEYLLESGHRDIALVLGPKPVYTTGMRRQGYLDAFHARGLDINENLIFFSDYTMQGGYETVKALLALKNRPTALFVTNYEMTLGAMIAVNEAGLLIPDGISFLGFDKLELLGAVFPNMAVVKQPQNAIGESAAGIMLSHLNAAADRAVPHQLVTLTAQLQPGSTVRAIKTDGEGY